MSVDVLSLTKNETDIGISEILRTGDLKSGIDIHFTLNNQILSVITTAKKASTFSNLKRSLEMFLTDEYKDSSFKRIFNTLQITISNNFKWMSGDDLKQQDTEYTVTDQAPEAENTETKTEVSGETNKELYQPVTISEAIRMHKGNIMFEGSISIVDDKVTQGATKATWTCTNCSREVESKIRDVLCIPKVPNTCYECEGNKFEENYEYINVQSLEITPQTNTEQFNLDPIKVYVFDKDTEAIRINGTVKIFGKIAKHIDKKTSRFYTVVYAKFVEYLDQRRFTITEKDRKEIKAFSKRKNLEADLIALFGKDVIGYEFGKLSCLLSAVGGVEILDLVNARIRKKRALEYFINRSPWWSKIKTLEMVADDSSK